MINVYVRVYIYININIIAGFFQQQELKVTQTKKSQADASYPSVSNLTSLTRLLYTFNNSVRIVSFSRRGTNRLKTLLIAASISCKTCKSKTNKKILH